MYLTHYATEALLDASIDRRIEAPYDAFIDNVIVALLDASTAFPWKRLMTPLHNNSTAELSKCTELLILYIKSIDHTFFLNMPEKVNAVGVCRVDTADS